MAKDFKRAGAKAVEAFLSKPTVKDDGAENENRPATGGRAQEDAQEVAQEVAQEIEGKTVTLHYSPEKLADRKRPRSQGRKGQQLPRRTIAFEPDLLTFTQKQAKAKGLTLSEYINDLIYVFKTNQGGRP